MNEHSVSIISVDVMYVRPPLILKGFYPMCVGVRR